MNRAFQQAPTAQIFFTEDLDFIEQFAPLLYKFKGLKVFHCLDDAYRSRALAAVPDLHVVERVRPDKFWSKSFSDGLSYSSNSMIGALNIADLLGAFRIYLLGVDCRMQGDKSNYHDSYPEERRAGVHQLDSFRSDFENWAAFHLRKKSVYNVTHPSCESTLTCWPKISFDRFYKVVGGWPLDEIDIKIRVDL